MLTDVLLKLTKGDTKMPASISMRRIRIPDRIRQLILSWLTAVTAESLLLPGELRSLAQLDGLARMSLARVLAITLAGFLLLVVLSRFLNTAAAERIGLAAVFAALSAVMLHASFSWTFLAACILSVAGFLYYAVRGWKQPVSSAPVPGKSSKAWLWITVGLCAAFFLFVSAWTVGRVYSFSTPSFDFGIFSQMFHNMKETGLPVTTLERDGALSHFRVHMSPIYYLLLPFYCLVPKPATLQVLQAAVLASSVIPLWKIAKHHGLSASSRMFLCAILLLYPAFSGGTGYDLHENCFLTPLILWLFYGIEKRSAAVTAVSVLLTLMVKEDAAVYTAVIALWLIIRTLLRFQKENRKDLIAGIVIFAISVAWFLYVTGYLSKIGDGVMTYRYSNFMYDGSSSLFTVIKAVILNPMKALYECAEPEKLSFIALTLLPLLGLPFLTRQYERYILLIPYLLVNLMSDYPYQHNLFFQYTFGSGACLIYLTAVNLADLKSGLRRILTSAAAALAAAVCFGTVIVPKAVRYPVQCVRNAGYYQDIRDTLSLIPDGASVSASTFYTTFLSQRSILYDIRHSSPDHILETEYIAFSITSEQDFKKYADEGPEDGLDNFISLLEANGYEQYAELPGVLVIYQKTA